jgi:hypothetical protein
MSTEPNKKPSLIAYQVRDTKTGQSHWTPIGAVWNNKDGGFTVQLDAIPFDGRIVCRPNKTDEQQ